VSLFDIRRQSDAPLSVLIDVQHH